jgi:diguanylate cyclase (GGDEF)-like protein
MPKKKVSAAAMKSAAQTPVRLLFVEDEKLEVELATRQLNHDGLAHESLRVETEEQLRDSLRAFSPDLILSDFSLPRFDGMSALQIVQEVAADVPFIFLSGTIGEERAIGALRSGAVDYIIKGNLARLAPAIRRALEEAAVRRERRRQEAQIARLNRVLQMLSGINGLVLRIRNHAELLNEACRFAERTGGYSAALVVLRSTGTARIHVAARAASSESVADALVEAMSLPGPRRELVDRALERGADFTLRDEGGALIALPLLVDRTAIGVLLLAATDPSAVSGEEMLMLRELAGNLSFGLQYLQTDTRMRFLSHFDPQTALARRSLFCERVQRSLAAADGGRKRYAVAVVDIERLGAINTSFGRRTGDLLLQHVADRLKRRFPATEEVAHFGGGTFGIVRNVTRPGVHRIEDLLPQIQEHALALFGEPFELEGRSIPVGARVGLALYPEDGRDAATLVQNAEGALQDARSAGEKHFHYRADKHSEAVAKLELEHRLRVALEKRQFELYYQPKVDVVTRRIQGVEALLRWNDPQRGLVSPAVFLPLLESSGLIVDVGRWIIERAAQDCREWRAAGLPPTRVAVNIAPAQLRQPEFAVEFLAHVGSWADARCGLDVEITESALHEDCGHEIRQLGLLRRQRIKVAVDDFGTGYSSLSRLSVLPVDTLKIDRSFVSNLGSASGKTLVRTIISLAKAFKLTTVAEGVETQEQLDVLWHMSCDQSQGFLHSKALPRDEFAVLLAHGRGNMIHAAEGDAPEGQRSNNGAG